MPLFQKWSHFDKEHVLSEPNSLGIYELGDSSGNILYIGEGRLHDRLNSHFINGGDPIPGTSKYRAEITGSKERAEQRERAELRDYIKTHGNCPRFNDRLG